MSDPSSKIIRAKVICVFRNRGRILVSDGHDPANLKPFYRPAGGGIEFGERSDEALRREILEELGSEIENLQLLGILENLFIYDGREGHEIVFVYDAELTNKALYAVVKFTAAESNGHTFNALWLDLNKIGPATPPLYPEGLLALLRQD